MKFLRFMRNEEPSEEAVVIEESVFVSDEGVGTSVSGKRFLSVARGALFLFIFALPIIFVPLTLAPVEMSKTFLGIFLALIAAIAWVGGSLQRGRVAFPSGWVVVSLALFLVGMFIATLFSVHVPTALFGSGAEAFTFLTLLVGGVIAFLIAALFSTREDMVRALVLLVVPFVVVAGAFVARSVFNVAFFGDRAFNTIGSWNTLAVFFGFVASLAFPLAGMLRGTIIGRISSVVLFLALLLVGIMNYHYVWVGLGFVAIMFFALSFTKGRRDGPLFALTFFLIIIALLGYLLRGPLGSTVAAPLGSPVEVGPSWESTMTIARAVISERPLFGFGPNTFLFAWDRFHPDGVNATAFWDARFVTGVSTIATAFVEIGIVGSALLLVLLFLALFMVGKVMVRASLVGNDVDTAIAASLASALVFLLVLSAFSAFNTTLLLLFFVVLGLAIAHARAFGVGRMLDIDFLRQAQMGFGVSLVLILVVIGCVFGLYASSTRYFAEVLYQQGVNTFTTTGAVNGAENTILRALALAPGEARFLRTLAELELVKTERAINASGITDNERRERLNAALSGTIEFAKQAYTANKEDVANARLLSRAYESAIPVSSDAARFAFDAYTTAREKSPKNPGLLRDTAQAHLLLADVLRANNKPGDRERAITEQRAAAELLEEAIRMKNDFASAHFLLARVYAVEGRTDEAIARAESAFTLSPNDVGVVFQLGVLYYQREDLVLAAGAFERAVALSENYSNARYYLGLIYARQGNRDRALAEFEKILSLNQGNADIVRIIENIKVGKQPLDGVPVPTNKVPVNEERPESPIQER